VVVGIVITAANAAPLPEAKPDDVGFSQQGLTRLDEFFAREISAKRVPGAVVAIAGLTLMEQGRLPLQARVAEYYPAFADMKVGVQQPDGHLPQRRAHAIFFEFGRPPAVFLDQVCTSDKSCKALMQRAP
jgi:hypothetical protein